MGLVLGFLLFGASGSSAKVPALKPSRLIVLLVQRLTDVSTMGVVLFLRLGVAFFVRVGLEKVSSMGIFSAGTGGAKVGGPASSSVKVIESSLELSSKAMLQDLL